MKRGMVLALVASMALTACSGGNSAGNSNDAPILLNLFGAAREAIAARTAGPAAARPRVTRALIDATPEPILEIVREEQNLTAYLQRITVRRDSDPGEINVWRVPNGPTVALRDGVLIATHGIGGDIQSSEVNATLAAIRARGGGGQRVQHIHADDNKLRRVSSACTVADAGPMTIEMVGRTYATRLLKETCEGALGRFENSYWIDSNSPVIWQSRQWAGPNVGYLRFRRLKL